MLENYFPYLGMGWGVGEYHGGMVQGKEVNSKHK